MRLRVTLLATLFAATAFAQGVIDVHSHIITPEFVSRADTMLYRLAEIEVYP
jgi:hypothetical protein